MNLEEKVFLVEEYIAGRMKTGKQPVEHEQDLPRCKAD